MFADLMLVVSRLETFCLQSCGLMAGRMVSVGRECMGVSVVGEYGVDMEAGSEEDGTGLGRK